MIVVEILVPEWATLMSTYPLSDKLESVARWTMMVVVTEKVGRTVESVSSAKVTFQAIDVIESSIERSKSWIEVSLFSIVRVTFALSP